MPPTRRPRLTVSALVALAVLLTAPALPVPAGAADGWGWPLAPVPRVLARLDPGVGRYEAGHRGVDLAAAPGQSVLAAGAGVVTFAGPVAGRPVVSVTHPGGLRTTYDPVTPLVQAGQAVARGQVIGLVTVGHCLPATCLHWGLRRGETYLDPLSLVGPPTVRLLPLRERWAQPDGGPQPDRGPLLARG